MLAQNVGRVALFAPTHADCMATWAHGMQYGTHGVIHYICCLWCSTTSTEGKPIPNELRNDEAKLRKEVELEDDNTAVSGLRALLHNRYGTAVAVAHCAVSQHITGSS